MTPGGQNGPMKMENVPIRCKVHEISECQDDMEDLRDQVQSLYYS